MIQGALIILLVAIAGLSKAVSDTVTHHYFDSIFSELNSKYWNPTISWKNKHKGGVKMNGPKFFLSTTALVMFTDAWHLFNFIGNTSMLIAITLALKTDTYATYPWTFAIICFLVLKSVFTGAFSLFYSKVFYRK